MFLIAGVFSSGLTVPTFDSDVVKKFIKRYNNTSIEAYSSQHVSLFFGCGQQGCSFRHRIPEHNLYVTEHFAALVRNKGSERPQLQPTRFSVNGSKYEQLLNRLSDSTQLSDVAASLNSAGDLSTLIFWSKIDKTITLVRDRMGQEPLYWGWLDNVLVIASQLRAFLEWPGYVSRVDQGSLSLFLRHEYVPAPWSMLKGIYKLPPGHFLKLPLDGSIDELKQIKPTAYWSFNEVVEQGLAKPYSGNDQSAVLALEDNLLDILSQETAHFSSVGALLSGGIDSTLISAIMQKVSPKSISTFTIDYVNSGHDEAVAASEIAAHLGTEHVLMSINPEQALDIVILLPTIFTEPLSSNSQISLYLLAKRATDEVEALFSGDGGDELFGGYNRYLGALQTWRRLQRLPRTVRRTIAASLRSLSPSSWDRLFHYLHPVLPSRYRLPIWGTKAQKLAEVLELDSEYKYFRRLTSHWIDPSLVVKDSFEPFTIVTDPSRQPSVDCFEHWMMALDGQTFLQEESMQKVYGAVTGAGLEAYSPLLDHRIVELAWKMPLNMKIRNGQGKWLMRQVLYRHVPRKLVDRPKRGFGLPMGRWLCGPLKEWANNLLLEERLADEGYFHPEPIVKMWHEHLAGKNDWQYQLWPILIFQAWSAHWL